MNISILNDSNEAGKRAAEYSAEIINQAIKEKGIARIVLSTGASQFPFFQNIFNHDIKWEKVEMFHLDEYVGISEQHPASFKKYLKERFVDKVNLLKAHLIDGQQKPQETIKKLTAELNKAPIDLGLIGIGENAHIAFNDPPADFEDKSSYKIVTLDEKCCMQQIKEGWFKNMDEVYKQAISMTCSQIMKCDVIISLVPYAVKAQALYDTVTSELTPYVPATLLKKHSDFNLYCDKDSASLLPQEIIKRYT